MESDTTSEEARDALKRIHDRNQDKADALAIISGKLRFRCETQDYIDVETVKEIWNETVDEHDTGPRIE